MLICFDEFKKRAEESKRKTTFRKYKNNIWMNENALLLMQIYVSSPFQ